MRTEVFAEHLFGCFAVFSYGFLLADSLGQDQHLYFENIDVVRLPEDKTRSSQSNDFWTINQKHSHLAVRRARRITSKHPNTNKVLSANQSNLDFYYSNIALEYSTHMRDFRAQTALSDTTNTLPPSGVYRQKKKKKMTRIF